MSESSRWFLTPRPSLSPRSPVALSLTGGAEGWMESGMGGLGFIDRE